MGNSFFITGIDTDIGKTEITGRMAKFFNEKCGERVVTAKLVQTGCEGLSEDVIRHRELMGIPLMKCDKAGITSPYSFKKPCSPHLAAKLEGAAIELDRLKSCIYKLKNESSLLLIEGAGGIMVPLKSNYYIIDFICDEQLPVILVATLQLGSINKTLLSIEMLIARGAIFDTLVINDWLSIDKEIEQDAKKIFVDYIQKKGLQTEIVVYKDDKFTRLDGNEKTGRLNW